MNGTPITRSATWNRAPYGIVALVWLLAGSSSQAQVAANRYDGNVTATGDRITVVLAPNVEAPIGAQVHTFRRVDVGQQEIGVLSGIYVVVGSGVGGVMFALRDPARNEGLPGASLQEAVQVASAGSGELQLMTDPPGARILWNGAAIGTTPDTLVLAAGRYALRIEHPGRVPTTYPFVVQSGRILTEHVRLDEPMPCQGFLHTAEAYFAQQDYARTHENLMTVQRGLCHPNPSNPALVGAWLESLPHIGDVQRRLQPGVNSREVAYALRRYFEALRTHDPSQQANQRRLLCQMAPTDPFLRSEVVGC